MKKALIVSFCLLFVLVCVVSARPLAKGTSSIAQSVKKIYNDMSDRPLEEEGLFSTAQPDTYWLAEFEFDQFGQCVEESWTHADLNAQIDTFFHVDTYRVIEGSQSMWCGARPQTVGPLCGYYTLPGYGNGWGQFFGSDTIFVSSGDAHIAFHFLNDTEAGWDFVYLQYLDSAGTWVDLATWTGEYNEAYEADVPGAAIAGSTQFRFYMSSDGAWSDEDGLEDTQGAIIIDSLIVSSVDDSAYEDFEDESVGDHVTTAHNGTFQWQAYPIAGYGDFAALFDGLQVLQRDPCTRDPSCLWAFFNGSTDDYGCAGYAGQATVPYENLIGQFIFNEVWSPPIDYNTDLSLNPVPATASSAYFQFRVYRELELDAAVFYVWHIRSDVAGCMGVWRDRNFVYYGSGPDWLLIRQQVGDLVSVGAGYVQLALGVWDMCQYWCPPFSGWCHSHSPLFDRVKFYRVDVPGPIWSVRDIELFQDNFAGCDQTGPGSSSTSTVRVDIALDRMPYTSPNIYIGDSTVVTVSESNYGLGTDPSYPGRASVYLYARSTGGQPCAAMTDEARYPVVDSAGGWCKILMDTVYNQGVPVPDKFCGDLSDTLFTAGDTIFFYFGAVDGFGRDTYYSAGAVTEAEAKANPMEMTCLPTGSSDILYVDDFSGRGAEPYFNDVFGLMNINPDRFDVRGPSSLVANGLGGRATSGEIIDEYQKIIWNSGDLREGTISDGTTSMDKSRDAQVLGDFLDLSSSWNPGLYITGDNIADEIKTVGGPPYAKLFSYIDFNVSSGDLYGLTGNPAPDVVGIMPGTIFQHAGPPAYPDTFVAYGGCRLINDFDVLEAPLGGNSNTEMEYDVGISPRAGVLSQATLNANSMTARVILEGFSFHYIRDDRPMFPFDRLDHMMHIITWFDNTFDPPTGAGDQKPAFVNYLAQNYPNPFNPRTTIEYSIREKAHVSLKVYNVAGQLVRTLVDEEKAPLQGGYVVRWDGRSDSGEPVSSGVYFYKLITKNFTQTKKMVLLK